VSLFLRWVSHSLLLSQTHHISVWQSVTLYFWAKRCTSLSNLFFCLREFTVRSFHVLFSNLTGRDPTYCPIHQIINPSIQPYIHTNQLTHCTQFTLHFTKSFHKIFHVKKRDESISFVGFMIGISNNLHHIHHNNSIQYNTIQYTTTNALPHSTFTSHHILSLLQTI